jgi:lysosomal alpha-mannosidase
LNKIGRRWTSKTDDFFPYATEPHIVWTGFYTSRPAFKGYERHANNILQVGKQLNALTNIQARDRLFHLSKYI